MPLAQLSNIQLYYEITGEGFPLVFSHEFAGDFRSWDAQVKFFSRRYQVITYNARGYPLSDVPQDVEAYSQGQAVNDLYELLRFLKIEQAHLAGLSMGGNAVLHFGLTHPHMARSLVVAGCGYGSTNREGWLKDVEQTAQRFEKEGMRAAAEFYTRGPARVQFLKKDPKGWQEFYEQFANHSATGSALTFRGVQLRRPSILDLKAQLEQLTVPTLIMTGDEDEPCIEAAIFMKRHIPTAGLVVFPKTGHTLNLEEPDLFNRTILDFLTMVESGKWLPRDPQSLSASALLPTSRT
ncbi:MAG: alpha/beta fold hydrolase [Candidatus Tectomicrobia bacterium]|nr:alpha/beta fold hydrolase [Candidatus Tectomicrobia bacterium]